MAGEKLVCRRVLMRSMLMPRSTQRSVHKLSTHYQRVEVTIEAQPTKSPDLNVLDLGLWNALASNFPTPIPDPNRVNKVTPIYQPNESRFKTALSIVFCGDGSVFLRKPLSMYSKRSVALSKKSLKEKPAATNTRCREVKRRKSGLSSSRTFHLLLPSTIITVYY